MGVYTSPAQRCRCRSTPSRRVVDVVGDPPKLQGAGTPKYMLEMLSSIAHKAHNLAITLKLELA